MDYSPYYFRRRGKVEERDYRAARPFGGRRRRGNGGEIFLIVVMLLSLIAILITANVYGKGYMMRALLGGKEGKEWFVSYMVVLGSFDDEREARSAADYARISNAAGYVFSDDNQYFVALATYSDKKEAEAVSEKNEGTLVKKISISRVGITDGAVLYAGDTLKSVSATLKELTVGYARKELLALDALDGIDEVRDALLAAKEHIYDMSSGVDKDRAIAMLEPLVDFLAAISDEHRADYVLREMRYAECMVVAELLSALAGAKEQ